MFLVNNIRNIHIAIPIIKYIIGLLYIFISTIILLTSDKQKNISIIVFITLLVMFDFLFNLLNTNLAIIPNIVIGIEIHKLIKLILRTSPHSWYASHFAILA